MPCYHPITGWRARFPNPSGKHGIVFKRELGLPLSKLEIPCGQCIGCRLERSRQWAVRCVNEASLYDQNCFVTLTYRDDDLPKDGSLVKRDFQLFFKRLRKRYGSGIRFFACGEYGERSRRPHYHACIFNFDFPDKVLWKITNDVRLYESAALQELWPYGFCTVGDCTFESAAYVARYVVKKVNGDRAQEHYANVDLSTGEWLPIIPEFTLMSRRPGIGAAWLDKWQSDVFPHDFLVSRGIKMKPPKYYSRRYEVENPDEWERISKRRRKSAARRKADCTRERLAVRERVKLAQISHLKRGLHDDS